jgi:hypothetical protein
MFWPPVVVRIAPVTLQTPSGWKSLPRREETSWRVDQGLCVQPLATLGCWPMFLAVNSRRRCPGCTLLILATILFMTLRTGA